MIGRTNFFYMFEDFIGDAEAQRTPFAQWYLLPCVGSTVIGIPRRALLTALLTELPSQYYPPGDGPEDRGDFLEFEYWRWA